MSRNQVEILGWIGRRMLVIGFVLGMCAGIFLAVLAIKAGQACII